MQKLGQGHSQGQGQIEVTVLLVFIDRLSQAFQVVLCIRLQL